VNKPVFLFRQLLFAILICLSGQYIRAQNHISGVVADSSGAGFPFANIALLRAGDSTQVKGSISNEQGQYEFSNLAPGTYLLKCFAVGFTGPYSQPLQIDSAAVVQLPVIVLRPAGVSLGEVSVTAIKKVIEFKNGMTVLNVENSIMAAGNTVLDILKRIPGVTVDNKNNIAIAGKQGVRIMIDGRMQQLSMEQLVAMMSAMSADQLKKIEVIKNPPVKYDAEGNAGLINLVTKKADSQGYSGSITYNPGMGQRFGNSMYATFNLKSRKWTVFSSLNPMYKIFYDRYDYHKTIRYNGQETFFDHTGDHENLRKYISGKIGADYRLNAKTTLGFSVGNTINKALPVEHGFVAINGFNDLGFDHYQYVTNENAFWQNPAYNLNAEHKFDTLGTMLSLSVDYTDFRDASDRYSESVFLNNDDTGAKPSQVYTSSNKSLIRIFTQKLDFQKYLKPRWLLETGAKATFVKNSTDFLFNRQDTVTKTFRVDTAFSNDYRYNETLLAGYINLRKEFKKGSVGFGVRAEHTEVSGSNLSNGFRLTRRYLNWFPSLSVDYQLNDEHALQFNYGRRLDRPSYDQLNPYKRFEDQYAVAAGNPYLNPQYSHNIDFTHVYRQWITNSVGYARFTQLFSEVSLQNDSTKVTTFTLANLDLADYAYYNLFLQKQCYSWWNVEFSLNVFYVSYKSVLSGEALRTRTLSSNIYINNDFLLPHDFKVQLTGHYNSPVTSGPNHNKANGSCDFGIKRSFVQNQFTVMFQFLDMFYTDINRSVYNFGNQYYTFNLRNDTRRFRLTLNYKFGKTNIRVAEKHSNEQENGRLQKN